MRKKPFFKVRVVHDPVKECFVVETKERFWKLWKLDTSFSYEAAYHKMFTEETAREAALDRALRISNQYIIAEF